MRDLDFSKVVRPAAALIISLAAALGLLAQSPSAKAAELGSKTAKNGFRNETEIQAKFNNWREDMDARGWLAAMNYNIGEIRSVRAVKPHGEKADVEVRITTSKGEKVEGISIKLVSSRVGFNQIDKRWLRQYVKIWKMPVNVESSLKLFVGETLPAAAGRTPGRSYLNELDPSAQKAVVDFFTANKETIVPDIFEGDGIHAAQWVMVAVKASEKTKWIIRSSADTIRFFGEGKVVITRSGNLKIGRITMQRKGGDGGRETAKMLQFKINPALLFDAK